MFEARDTSDTRPKSPRDEKDVLDASDSEVLKHRHSNLMELLKYESERQSEERMQMQTDQDYYDHLQWRQEDAKVLMDRGQAPIVFNESRQTIDWIAGTEKRMRKDYKILPREPNDEQGAELKTKLIKYTDDVNSVQWQRSKAFKVTATCGLSWLEEGVNPDPEEEVIYSGIEDWRNVFRDSHSRDIDYNQDARYLFRRRIVDLDYAIALLPKHAEHLRTMAAAHENPDDDEDIWYMGEKLTGATETEWSNAESTFGARSAYMARSGYYDTSKRTSVELIECWYKVPETVKVFTGGEMNGKLVNDKDPEHQAAAAGGHTTYETVKMRMRFMLCTKQGPMIDAASPFKHNKFTLVPLYGFRRARDGLAYGVMRGMRDIQDDLNKRRSKALFALSVNRIVMDEGAVDDIEDLRQEAARPDGIIVKKANRALGFEENRADFQNNLELAAQDSQILRNVGGVTNENLGRDTNAASGKAILAKQDQGSLTTSELFDNLLLAIKFAGKLRLSNIEQFYTEAKAVRIVGERRPVEWLEINKTDPITGQMLNDVTAMEADFIVDTQDYRTSMAQAALEQMFDLLGKIATFAPQVVVNVLDLVVETADLKDKEEWVTRIRKLNGQRDPSKPPTPEEEQQEQATIDKQIAAEKLASDTGQAQLLEIQAKADKLKADIAKMDADGVLRRIEGMYSALQAAQIVATTPNVTPAADEITKSAGMVDLHPGNIPTPPPGAMPPPDQAMQPPMGPADPMPPPPDQLDGMQAGIETPTGADNMIPPQE